MLPRSVFGFVLLGLLKVRANEINFYKDCGSVAGEVKAVRVSNCESSPCLLSKGQEEFIEIDFVPKYDTDKMTIKVSAILIVEIPWTAMNPDACLGIQSCPLKAGKTYTFKTHMPVQSIYPEIAVTVKLQLLDSSNRVVTCITLPMKIVPGNKQTSPVAQAPAALPAPPPAAPEMPQLPGQGLPMTTTSTVPGSAASVPAFTTTTTVPASLNSVIPAAPPNTQNSSNSSPNTQNSSNSAPEQKKGNGCDAGNSLYSYTTLLLPVATVFSVVSLQSWIIDSL